MKRYRQLVSVEMANVPRQRLDNFLGRGGTDDIMVLSGAAMNEIALLNSRNLDLRVLSVYFARVGHQSTDDAFKISIANWKMEGFYLPWIAFIGLAAMRLSKSGYQRRKNLRRARLVMKDHESSRKMGNVNTHVLLLLLAAEYSVLHSNGSLNMKIKRAFDTAIAAAKRSD